MSKKITVEKFEEFILKCVNEMETGEKVVFTKNEKPLAKDHTITLTKVDDDRFTVIEKGTDDIEYSNIDFNGVIKELMKLKEKEFGDCEHFFAHKA
ncbi:hypothetical protein [Candidatus Cetobacterium colombiensis]|uniref:Uncharacterized protein n=1 Tax=Candidatus Cetobacterium colombiensis TaxID=3073100 RepID=A0ABU4W8Z7_9FUSO|nr:hypothetical protein [Candidatus Cetobacterium colombiensis]MDX8335988.1 hypothetical protein [Candidatus Cetobacterium colombiensis]